MLFHASALPIAVTHGNQRSFCDSPRNKPDAVIDAVAGRGGVIGCTLYPLFMGGADVTLNEYCSMLAALADRVGAEHVAIGSDAVVGWQSDALGWMAQWALGPSRAVGDPSVSALACLVFRSARFCQPGSWARRNRFL